MTKPGMIITGATGFLGGRLIRYLSNQYTIFALARRSPQEVGGLEGPDIHWFQVDIGHFDPLREVFYHIREMGGAELVLHMAGYYDFTGEEHPEYTRTNVLGTRNVLELSVPLQLKKFIFTSSVAACPFPPPGEAITEATPPTAPPPYSRSKRKGEEMLALFKDELPSCILRLAAIFSNWCEYEPMHNFLATWFSGDWNARILGGRGQWAIPYLHVRDLLTFYLRVVEKADELKPLEVLQASPNGCTTHLQLFREATGSYYNEDRSPIYVPKPLARMGIVMREVLGRLTGTMPFERSWMGEYIDLKLNIDAARTHRRLAWEPHPELDILNCIPVMVHNMRSNPEEWQKRYELSRKGKKVRGKVKNVIPQG
ncbi:MAG: NAD(P)-dependent oxidoreductase [Anaerolineae bacterium]|nr:NAD(P)-dependent oxidoreductase [Anaerolineae bacterium]MCB0224278.1 NAD(P)-dependent oxidoreductase [Anaerolineae bacterium]MCB9105109.1 NAD(P)-dependent oxidoreductase [Anaerolineales bacterium]